MKILVTGATGFLGSSLVKAFLLKGHEVMIFKRSHSNTARLSDILDKLIVYDLNVDGLEKPLKENEQIDLVIHAATSYGRVGESTFQIFETNTVFSLQLLSLAVKHGVETFMNMDTSVPRSLNAYALSKKQFVEWGDFYSRQEAVRFVNAEMEHFYGPGDSETKFTTHVIRQCYTNVPELDLTPGKQKRDFIYIDDIVAAILLLTDKKGRSKRFENYSIGSGKAVAIRYFVELVQRITSSKTKLNFGSLSYRKNEVMFSQADITTLNSLGWSPMISLEEGIRRTVEAEKLAH